MHTMTTGPIQAGQTVYLTPGVTVARRLWIATTRGVIHDHRIGRIESDISPDHSHRSLAAAECP